MNEAQSIVKLEEFGNGLRDVIWNEANVMDGKAGYRMYIWKHMAKNVWLPIHVCYFLTHWKEVQETDLKKKKNTKTFLNSPSTHVSVFFFFFFMIHTTYKKYIYKYRHHKNSVMKIM